MKNSSKVLLVGLLLGLSCSLVAQEEKPSTQFGNFLFNVPNGWNPQEKGDIMLIYAPSPPPGTTGYIALAADDIQGNLENSFKVLWSGFANSYRIQRGGQPAPLHFKKGFDAYYTEAIASDKQGRTWHVSVVAAQYRNRVQTVMFMDNFDESYHNATYNIFKRWLSNLSFGDALPGSTIPPADAHAGDRDEKHAKRNDDDSGTGREPSADEDKSHKVPPGMLEGFYVGGAVSGRYGTGIGRNHLYFTTDGWVLKIDLNNSMVGFDATAYRNKPDTNRSWIGRYRVDGNDIHILWQDYTEHRDVIHRNEAAANPAINVYIPECRCTGRHFAGKYLWGLATSGQYIQFFADGTFIDHGVTDQMIVPNPFFDRPRNQRGTYNIQNQSIIFSYTDGHRAMKTFLAPKAQEKAGTFDWIGLGINTLYEEHYQAQP